MHVACAEQGYEARNDGEALSFCPWVQIQDSREEPAWQARYRAAQISCGDICERVLLAWARGVRLLLFPKSNVEFWRSKIERNRERDLREAVELRSQGWHVIKIWECQLKPKVRTATLTSLEYTLNCIFLMNHGAKEHSEAKPYEEAKSPVPIAAELCEKYGNNQGE